MRPGRRDNRRGKSACIRRCGQKEKADAFGEADKMISYDGMFLGTERELTLLMFAFLTGMVLGSVFDLFRALRLSIRHPGWAVAAEDIAFCLIFGLTFFSFGVELTEGQPRLFVLAGMAADFWFIFGASAKLSADCCQRRRTYAKNRSRRWSNY